MYVGLSHVHFVPNVCLQLRLSMHTLCVSVQAEMENAVIVIESVDSERETVLVRNRSDEDVSMGGWSCKVRHM